MRIASALFLMCSVVLGFSVRWSPDDEPGADGDKHQARARRMFPPYTAVTASGCSGAGPFLDPSIAASVNAAAR